MTRKYVRGTETEVSFSHHGDFTFRRTEEPADSLPLQYFLSLLFRDLDSQVPKGLYNLLGIDAACKDKAVSSSTCVTSCSKQQSIGEQEKGAYHRSSCPNS